MNGIDLLDIANGIDEEFIASAAKTRGARRRLWYSLAAAACAVAAAVAVTAALRGGTPQPETQSALMPAQTGTSETVQTAVPTAVPTEAPTPEPVILYAPGAGGIHEFVPSHGGTNIDGALNRAINDGEHEDCLFAVNIGVTDLTADVYERLLEEFLERSHDEYFKKYGQISNEWVNGEVRNWLDQINEEAGTYNQGSPEWRATYYHKMEEYALTQMSEEEWNRCKAANAAYHEAEARLGSYSGEPEVMALAAERLDAEFERLKSVGLSVYRNDKGGICGCLTAEQIRNFPGSTEYGYYIYWQGHGGGIAE